MFDNPIPFTAEFNVSVSDLGKAVDASKNDNLAGKWIIEGYASTGDLDEQSHIITPEAIKMGAECLQKYRTLLYNHDSNRPIGSIELAEAQGANLFIKAQISKTEPHIWAKIKDGTLSKFSIRGRITDAEKSIDTTTQKEILMIKGMALHEVSVVSVPANPGARSLAWYVEKAMAAIDKAAKPEHYPFDQCLADRKAAGYDDKAAAAICGAIKNRTISHMIEWGMAETEEAAIKMVCDKYDSDPVYAYAWQKFMELAGGCTSCNDKATKDLNEGNSSVIKLPGSDTGVKPPFPGNITRRGQMQMTDAQKACVGTKIREGMASGKKHDQAIAYALGSCKVQDQSAKSLEEITADLLACLPEIEQMAKEIEDEIKVKEGGDSKVDVNKNQEHLAEAIKQIQEAVVSLSGEAKDQAEAVIRSLTALNTAVYGAAKKDGDADSDVEKAKKKAMASDGKDAEPDADPDDKAKKAMEDLVSGLKASIQEGLEKTIAETSKMAAVKESIEKQVAEVVKALEKLPIRKGQGVGDDIDRSGDGKDLNTAAGLAKAVKSEAGYEKLIPGDQLHRLLATFSGERKVK